MNTREKAARAKRLREDEAFASFMQEVRDEQMASFANSGADETATREEAHAILRALGKIENRLQAAIDAQTMKEKGKHRGSD